MRLDEFRLKVKRAVVYDRYAGIFDALYAG